MKQEHQHKCIAIKQMTNFNTLESEEQTEINKKVSDCESCKARWRRYFNIDR